MSLQVNVAQPVSVFFSYSHADEELRDELAKHLSILQRQRVIELWHDRGIAPGTPWAREIDEHLNQADIILLLISVDFLASDYVNGVELKRALERHDDLNDETCVIPVILRTVDWQSAALGKLRALPKDGHPITLWPNRDMAFADVARGVREAAEAIRKQRESRSPTPAPHVESGAAIVETSGDVKPALPPNPYRGLHSFREEHASFFFGRDAATMELNRPGFRRDSALTRPASASLAGERTLPRSRWA